jgi:hypothetical protein
MRSRDMKRSTAEEAVNWFATQPRDRLIEAEEAKGNGNTSPAAVDETMYARRKSPQGRATPVARRVAIATRTSVLVVGLMLLLGACITNGTVTEKSSDLGRVSCSFDPLDCDHSGECWQLHLEDAQGRTGRVCVPLEDWLLTDVGDYYDGPTVIQ